MHSRIAFAIFQDYTTFLQEEGGAEYEPKIITLAIEYRSYASDSTLRHIEENGTVA